MASRMERYYRAEERSKKNQNLYDQISDIKEVKQYSNIENVVDISNSNEININDIKELLNMMDNKQNKQHYVENKEIKQEKEEEKNYDIKDVLSKAKTKHSDTDLKHRNLKIHQYKLLKKLKEEHPDNEDIDELLNTLALTNESGDDLGIFDELKSDTMVGAEAASIKKVLDEAKDIEENGLPEKVEEEEHTSLDDLDKSFYTDSFSFSNKDFDDLRSLDKNIRKNNKLIKILIIALTSVCAIIILMFIGKLIF